MAGRLLNQPSLLTGVKRKKEREDTFFPPFLCENASLLPEKIRDAVDKMKKTWYNNEIVARKENKRMRIECYGGRGYEANCYLIMDDSEAHALVLDPSVDFHTVLRQRGKALPTVEGIFLSHAHFDHMLAVDDWREKTGAPLAVHEADGAALGNGEANAYRLFMGRDGGTQPAERLLCENDTVCVGNERLTVLHTPGHTPGCICLYTPGILLSGDTLFDGCIGRSDLPGGQPSALMASLRALAKLPGETKVYPGHGPATTIEREKKYNPYIGE